MSAEVQLLWDASGLVKRYYDEEGRETVNALFAVVPTPQMATTPWGYAETFSILLRRHNSGVLDRAAFTDAVTSLQAEVVTAPDFRLLSITDALVFTSLSLMQAHNLNATDAAILATYLNFQRSQPADAPTYLLVAADQRLLRAGAAEGLAGLNPQFVPAATLPAFLAGL
ncbi:MAG: type II toxin-antitoxin system VapC family toxin [Armatimonadota bacterium]|nr:type II toxin-antitoxin system VapC family toxin [Armatimonadota bacterium]